MTKRIMPAYEFNRWVGAAINAARSAHVVVTNHGRPQFVMVNYIDYEALLTERRQLGVLREAEAARQKALTEGRGDGG